jgi:hypothetical protein
MTPRRFPTLWTVVEPGDRVAVVSKCERTACGLAWSGPSAWLSTKAPGRRPHSGLGPAAGLVREGTINRPMAMKSSSFFPDLRAAANHRGFNP